MAKENVLKHYSFKQTILVRISVTHTQLTPVRYRQVPKRPNGAIFSFSFHFKYTHVKPLRPTGFDSLFFFFALHLYMCI